MSYSPPAITAAGLSVPSFSDIQSAMLFAYQTIWGATTYLGNDSADYQWVSALALKLSDNASLCQLAYNSRSPLTAIGSALDSLGVLTGGVSRKSSTPSTVVLTLVGTAGQEVDNAVIQDVNGILWTLPAVVFIGSGGTVNVSAVCQQSGP
ncbi:MAG TPA: baseplate J/gp47 family protein, partial [Candidatus Saccharimonadales bacterium]